MSKKIKSAIITFALATVVALSAALSACTIKTNHPQAKITISFNDVTYDIEYKLYRNMYPQTVQHFIELADANFYDNMIIHDYESTDWLTGGYSYNLTEKNNEEISINYETASTGNSFSEYLEYNTLEDKYYDLFNQGTFSSSVYKKLTYDEKTGAEQVQESDKLPTLIGEFSENGHNIDKGSLTASFGSLKMYYYDKGDSNQKVAIKNSFGELMEHDYKYNCATSIFAMQVGNSTSYSASKYCVFAELKNDNAKDTLNNLIDAISEYIIDVLGGSSSKFSTTVDTKVENLDTFTEDGGREIETSFIMTTIPLIVKSVKITKY